MPLFAGVVAPCLVALCCSCRTHTVAPPKRVCALSRKISLTGKVVPVDFYLPKGVKSAPVVIIAHGFTRSRLNMASTRARLVLAICSR